MSDERSRARRVPPMVTAAYVSAGRRRRASTDAVQAVNLAGRIEAPFEKLPLHGIATQLHRD
jgi:hypothetical protein